MKAPLIKATVTVNGTSQDFESTIVFADLVKVDVIRKRYKYPTAEEAEAMNMGLCLFASLVRAGKIDANSNPDTFLETIEWIELLDDGTGDEEESKSL